MSNPYEPPSDEASRPNIDRGRGQAAASLILGLVSTVTWFFPLLGLSTSLSGVVLGIVGLGPMRRGSARAGLIFSSLGLASTLATMGMRAYWIMTGQYF